MLKARKNPLTIELLFLDGEEARLPEWGGTDNTYGSRHYVDAAQARRLAGDAEGAGPGRHDRRPRSRHPPRHQLDAVADRHRSGTPRGARSSTTTSSPSSTRIEDDHLPFLAAGVPSVDIIDLDYPPWHTPKDTLDAVSARSLQVVGDVVLAALPTIEAHLSKTLVLTGRRIGSAPVRTRC